MSQEEKRTGERERGGEAFIHAVAASVPSISRARSGNLTQVEQPGLISRWIESREARRHRETLIEARNAAEAAIYAINAFGVVANDRLADKMEVERGFEKTIYQNKDSELCMATAPEAVHRTREIYDSVVDQVMEACGKRITSKIAR